MLYKQALTTPKNTLEMALLKWTTMRVIYEYINRIHRKSFRQIYTIPQHFAAENGAEGRYCDCPPTLLGKCSYYSDHAIFVYLVFRGARPCTYTPKYMSKCKKLSVGIVYILLNCFRKSVCLQLNVDCDNREGEKNRAHASWSDKC